MAPHLNGEVFYQPWDTRARATDPNVMSAEFDHRFACNEQGEGDLYCTHGNWATKRQPRLYQCFFRRVAYHLFFSTRKVFARSTDEVLEKGWLLSELYRRSFEHAESPRTGVDLH